MTEFLDRTPRAFIEHGDGTGFPAGVRERATVHTARMHLPDQVTFEGELRMLGPLHDSRPETSVPSNRR